MNRKGFSLLIVIGIIAVIVIVGVVGYFIWNNNSSVSSPQNPPCCKTTATAASTTTTTVMSSTVAVAPSATTLSPSTISTSGWQTYTDSQNLFSIQAPAAWGLVMTETPGDLAPVEVKDVNFAFPDGTPLFTIGVFETSTAVFQPQNAPPYYDLLGTSNEYDFGEENDFQTAISYGSVSYNEISSTLPKILATFKVLPSVSSVASSSVIAHVIDAAGVDPSIIPAGSAQPVIFTADISDPTVIASSVELTQINPDSSTIIIGSLQQAGNGVFSIQPNLSGLSAGDYNFRISAAFTGQQQLSQGTFPFAVMPAIDTTQWTSVSPGNYFTMKLPPNTQIVEGLSGAGYDIYNYVIQLSDGTALAWIDVFTPSQWATSQDIESDGGGATLLSTGNRFVIGYELSESQSSNDIIQALATVKSN